jgi:hypothetical protein
MREAMLYEKLDNGTVRCDLCAHRCTVHPGRQGNHCPACGEALAVVAA